MVAVKPNCLLTVLTLVALPVAIFVGSSFTPAHSRLVADSSCGSGTGSGGSGCCMSNGIAATWGGYVALGPGCGGPTFTSVVGEWVQPSVTCPTAEDTESRNGTQYTSFWVGLDGYKSHGVEQAGTSAKCIWDTRTDKYHVSYEAWYEMFPLAAVFVAASQLNPTPGSQIQASVTYNGNSSYTLKLSAGSSTFSTTQTCPKSATCQNLSAEWVAEKNPTHDLATFSSWQLTGGYATTTTNSQQQSVASFQSDPPFTLVGPLDLTSRNQRLTYNTCNLNGASFTVQFNSCT